MTHQPHRTAPLALGTIVTALLALPLSSAAQTTGSEPSRSYLPYTSNGYFGVNLGTSDYRKDCVGGFECDDSTIAGKLYTGGMFSRAFGAEIAYINTGNADRNGGETKAQGVNISLVGNLPVTDRFNVFAKGGTTYAWTEVSAAPATGVASGKDNGFGLSFGAGVGFDVTRDIQVVGEWDRNRMKFVSGRENVDLYSVGVRFKF